MNNALTLDIGYKLVPLPEEQWKDKLTQAQEMTWCLISSLSEICHGAVAEQSLYNLSGLTSPLPFRSRVKHLIEKGALISQRVD